MRNQLNSFDYKFGKNIKVFEFWLKKMLSLLFDLIAFFLLTCCFFRVRQNNRLFLSLSSNLRLCSKYGFVVFYREFTKLATGVSFFVPVASAVAMVGPGRRILPNDCLCPFHFGLLKMLFRSIT